MLLNCKDKASVLSVCVFELSQKLNIPSAKFFILAKKPDEFEAFSSKTLQFEEIKIGGIASESFYNDKIIKVSNPLEEKQYNPLIDLKTTLSVLAVPLYDEVAKETRGVLEVINIKMAETVKLRDRSSRKESNIPFVRFLEQLGSIVSIILQKTP